MCLDIVGWQLPYILSTARGFEEIAGKGGGVEYLILNFYSPRGHVQWNVQSIGDIISFNRIYDSYFSMTSEVTEQGSRYQEVCAWTCFVFLFFFVIFLQIFPSLSLFVSLFLFSFLLGIYLIFWPCLFTETSRAFEKRQGQSRFSELNFSSFFRHLKASGVLPVGDSGLILQTYKEIYINRICE